MTYKEWAPGALEVYLVGDFNNWNKTEHKLEKDEYGNWSIFLKDLENGDALLKHLKTKYKLWMKNAKGEWKYRVSAWTTYAV